MLAQGCLLLIIHILRSFVLFKLYTAATDNLKARPDAPPRKSHVTRLPYLGAGFEVSEREQGTGEEGRSSEWQMDLF